MRRKTFMRDFLGTSIFLVILLVLTFAAILGEKALEAFKSH